MKKLLFLTLSFAWFGFSGPPNEKYKYQDNSLVLGDTKIIITDALATDEVIKAKVFIENKNDYFILLNPEKSYYFINGNKNYTKESEIVIPPNGKKGKVFDVKGPNLHPDALSIVLDGLTKTGNEKIVSFPDTKIPSKKKENFGNIEVIVTDVDYDHSDKLHIKVKIINIGNELVILNSSVVELSENGNTLNNIRKRTNQVLIRKGDSENMGLTFQTASKGGDKNIVWNDAFTTASTLPMNPIEIGIANNNDLLSNYKYCLGPVLEKSTKKTDEPLAINNKNKTPAEKKEPVKKSEPVKKDVSSSSASNPPKEEKRAMEDDVQELHAADISFVDEGAKFYALLIGISDYADPGIADLDNLPVNDVLSLEKVLTTNYTFNKENVNVLKNPTRREIVIALDNIAKKAGPTDNVLIFYAGHGHYEDDNDIGYWLPKDAELSNSSNWLYNDQLVASMRKIKSLHTLLVSDACFSGSIFKNRSINLAGASDVIKKKYQLPSRKAMTSGTLKTVPNKSVFIKYLLDRLEKNKIKYLSTSALYQSIEQPVGNNSNSLPQFGVIQNVGDEGGDFIFIKR